MRPNFSYFFFLFEENFEIRLKSIYRFRLANVAAIFHALKNSRFLLTIARSKREEEVEEKQEEKIYTNESYRHR